MRHPATALSRVTIALCALLLLLPARARADAAPDPDEAVDQITQLNRDAITSYQAKKFDEARKLLKQALDLATAAGLDKHAIKARTHIHFGVVIIGGFNQRDLGIKQFRKAIEIQADIGLTKSLITPELQEAFNEAKAPLPASPPSTPSQPPPEPAVKTPPSKPDSLGTGLTHEPVAEGKQGSAISITVEVAAEMEFEKLILAYRPEGASDFLGREMKEVADGKYGAEIPTTATSGSTVAYYIEAEDANSAPIAAKGSVDNPIVIHLLGVGVTRNDDDDDDDDGEDGDDEGPSKRLFLGLMAGMGMGWATGTGDTNADVRIDPPGLATAGLVQVAPEFGYWLDSSLMLSLQIRYQYITGTTDIHAPNSKVYHTANYALAAFAKATWKFGGESKLHPFFSLSAGAGRIRHVVSFKRQMLTNCGEDRMQTCIDTIGAGPILAGPGGGIMYDFGDNASVLVQLNSVLAFPDFSVHFDGNVGVAFGF